MGNVQNQQKYKEESVISEHFDINDNMQQIVGVMLPVYLVDDEVCSSDIELTQRSWKMILDGSAVKYEEYLNQCKLDNTPMMTSVMQFHETFYSRLFDVHPLAKPLFRKGLQSQGKLLVKMLTLLTNLLDSSSLDDTRKFNQSLIALAETHNDRGVKSTEYGIVGEVLLWTLRKCLGSAYTPNIHMAWLRILSKILRVMVPVAVSLELNEGRAQEDRLDTLHTNYDSLYNCMEPSDVCTTEITDQRRASLDYAAYWAKQTRDKTNKITVLSNMK